MKEKPHYFFITGNLAYKGLHNVLSYHDFPFTYSIANLNVGVAALLNTRIILRRLQLTQPCDAVYLPGRFRGNLEELTQNFGVPFLRGPKELKELPDFFGKKPSYRNLDQYAINVFAEITDAPNMQEEAILKEALLLQGMGANVIDIGCLPDTPFPHLQQTIATLQEHNLKVSVDTIDTKILKLADHAGADYLLSITTDTLWLAKECNSIPILIPKNPQNIKDLYKAMENLLKLDKKFIADPILEPIHCGFTTSILRYHTLRKHYPEVEIMMGLGNLTELTHADTSGSNAMLLGIVSELNIQHVLTTSVSGHCREVLREIDCLRRILYVAKEEKTFPANIDEGAIALHERKPFLHSTAEIQEGAGKVRDQSYRIQVNTEGIHLYNNNTYTKAADPFDIYPSLQVEDDSGHAFYLGVELARAQIAWQLGKRYEQDEPLKWGCVPPLHQTDMHNFKPAGTTMQKKHVRKNKRTQDKG